jgi:Flp pilus assembly pilin Flp
LKTCPTKEEERADMKDSGLMKLLRQIHQNEDGAISLETILIIGAIALPILIFLIKVGWPTIKSYFETGVSDLQNDATSAQSQ